MASATGRTNFPHRNRLNQACGFWRKPWRRQRVDEKLSIGTGSNSVMQFNWYRNAHEPLGNLSGPFKNEALSITMEPEHLLIPSSQLLSTGMCLSRVKRSLRMSMSNWATDRSSVRSLKQSGSFLL